MIFICACVCSRLDSVLIDSLFFAPQEIRDKVKLLLQLADTLLSSGNNVHTQAISHWADNVDLKYKDFSCRIDQLKYYFRITLQRLIVS